VGDLFNDGHLDVVVNNMDSSPALLRNVVKNDNHWIAFRLIGGPKSPRDAIGAKVFVTASGVRQQPTFFPEAATAPAPINEFILAWGRAANREIEIHWLAFEAGIMVPAVDRIFSVAEGKGLFLIKLRRDLSKLD